MRIERGYAIALSMVGVAALANCNLVLGVGYDWDGKGGSSSSSSSTGTGAASSSSSTGTGGMPVLPGTALWAYSFGSSGEDKVNAVAVSPAVGGHIFLTGKAGGAGDFGCQTIAPGSSTMPGGFLIEIDDMGKCVWGLFFGANAEGTGLTIDASTNLILVGTYSTELKLFDKMYTAPAGGFAVRINFPARDKEWIHRFASASMSTTTVTSVVTTLQNTYVAGYTDADLVVDDTPTLTGISDEEGFVFSCVNTPQGTCSKFVRIVGEAGKNQEILGLAFSSEPMEADKEWAIAGKSVGSTGFNGATMVPPPVAADTSPNAIIGTFDNTGFNQRHGIYGDIAAQTGMRVAYGASGHTPLFFAGTFLGNLQIGPSTFNNVGDADIFIARFETGTDASAAQRIGSDDMGATDLGGIATDALNNLYVVGTARDTTKLGNKQVTSAGSADAFAARLGNNLDPAWFVRFGDGADQFGDAVAITKEGDVIIVGHYAGQMDFGNGHKLTANDGGDIFVAKLKP